MVSYNPKDWVVGIFMFHKADTIRKLFWPMVVVALYCWGVAFIEIEYLNLSQNSHVKSCPTVHRLVSLPVAT